MKKLCQKSTGNKFLTMMDYLSQASFKSLQVDFHFEMNGNQRLPGGWEINLKTYCILWKTVSRNVKHRRFVLNGLKHVKTLARSC